MTTDTMTPAAFVNKKFDYLIIGGGTAGLVIAARLSENGIFNVGVLEAGYDIPENTPAVSVPGHFGDGIGTEYDWKFETTPQKQLSDRKLSWPRGKALGGSSALNFMTWNRPSGDDLDAWERLGCEGWGWKEMLPFYKKSENLIAPDAQTKKRYKQHFDDASHGKGGPVTISFCKEYSDAHQFWHETMNNLGVSTNETPMSGSNTGAWTSISAVNPETATREYAASAYLMPAKRRKNLSVLTGATVRNIVIEKADGEWVAKGVNFEHNGSTYTVHTSKEVILSAGSVKSPQILELSGIGNSSILQKAGIEPQVQNLNVGENLQDHLLTATIYEIDPSVLSPDDLRNDPEKAMAADNEYQTERTGLRTWLAGSLAYIPIETIVSGNKEQLAALASRLPAQAANARDQTIANRITKPSSNHGYVEYIFDVGNWNPSTPVKPGKKYATLLQILQYSFSRGSIHVNAAAPYEDPIINPQYFENEGEIDLEIQIHGAEFGKKMLETEPLKSFVKDRAWPPKDVTKEEWKEWMLANITTDWHPVGTCAMGKSVEDGGVVDSRLRVFGVKGLRVADASIMPLQISAHLQATVYAIGEKAASMILEDAGVAESIDQERSECLSKHDCKSGSNTCDE